MAHIPDFYNIPRDNIDPDIESVKKWLDTLSDVRTEAALSDSYDYGDAIRNAEELVNIAYKKLGKAFYESAVHEATINNEGEA